ERQPRRLVQPGAVIDIDEIQPYRVLADAHFARSRGRQVDRLVHQRLRSSHLVHAHGLGHSRSPEQITSAHFPKFVHHTSNTFYELRKAMGTSKSIILVPLFDLKSLG